MPFSLPPEAPCADAPWQSKTGRTKHVTHNMKMSFFCKELLQLAFCNQEALQRSSCSSSRTCSPTESHKGSSTECGGKGAEPQPRMGQAAQTTSKRVFEMGNFLSCIPSRLVFVKINPILLYKISFITCVPFPRAWAQSPYQLYPSPCTICINAAFTSAKTLTNFCHS